MSDNAIKLVLTMLEAIDVIVLLSNLANFELEDFHDEAKDKQRKFIALSEQVSVVQYRKIRSK